MSYESERCRRARKSRTQVSRIAQPAAMSQPTARTPKRIWTAWNAIANQRSPIAATRQRICPSALNSPSLRAIQAALGVSLLCDTTRPQNGGYRPGMALGRRKERGCCLMHPRHRLVLRCALVRPDLRIRRRPSRRAHNGAESEGAGHALRGARPVARTEARGPRSPSSRNRPRSWRYHGPGDRCSTRGRRSSPDDGRSFAPEMVGIAWRTTRGDRPINLRQSPSVIKGPVLCGWPLPCKQNPIGEKEEHYGLVTR